MAVSGVKQYMNLKINTYLKMKKRRNSFLPLARDLNQSGVTLFCFYPAISIIFCPQDSD
jgi:hypothetical protein